VDEELNGQEPDHEPTITGYRLGLAKRSVQVA